MLYVQNHVLCKRPPKKQEAVYDLMKKCLSTSKSSHKEHNMQYTPVYKHTGYQITETYFVEDVTYTAEITIAQLTFSTGMAGFDPFHATINLFGPEDLSLGIIQVNFPKIQARDEHHPLRMLVMERERHSPSKREFSPYGEKMLKEAVLAFLEERKRYQIINRTCNSYTFNCS